MKLRFVPIFFLVEPKHLCSPVVVMFDDVNNKLNNIAYKSGIQVFQERLKGH